MSRRIRQNVVALLFSVLVCLSIWNIVLNPVAIDPDFERTEETFGYVLNSPNSSYTYPTHLLPPDDYTQLMDLKRFQFLILNTPCNETSPLLLILVHSAPWNFERRQLIRETWGQKMDNVVVLFMLGTVEGVELRRTLAAENKRFGDFVQGNFVDHYRNLTYKHAMVFKYAIYHCPAAKYILKADDDVFVNLVTFMDFLHEELSPNGVTDFLMCSLRPISRPLRSFRSKWRVSVKEWPYRTYPEMCPGYALLYSDDSLFKFYTKLQNATYFWIDDVLITGYLREQLHLKLVSAKDWIMNPKAMSNFKHYKRLFLFGPPEISLKNNRRIWDYTLSHVKSKHFRYAFQKQSESTHNSQNGNVKEILNHT